jgi:hypothetical protein
VHSAAFRARDHASPGTEIDLACNLGEIRRLVPERRHDVQVGADTTERTERAQLLERAKHVFGSQRQIGDRVETPDVDDVGAFPRRGVQDVVPLGNDTCRGLGGGKSPDFHACLSFVGSTPVRASVFGRN